MALVRSRTKAIEKPCLTALDAEWSVEHAHIGVDAHEQDELDPLILDKTVYLAFRTWRCRRSSSRPRSPGAIGSRPGTAIITGAKGETNASQSSQPALASAHFTLEPLTEGVYACIHKPGGAAFSNAGIVDLGDRTLVVDAFQTRTAASDLRRAAEALFERPVDTVVLTHGHNDHWTGACAFAADTRLLASPAAQKACLEWAPLILEDFQDAALWEGMLYETEQRLQAEADPRVRAGLEHSISFFRYVLAEREGFQPRTPEQTFENRLSLQGSARAVELHSLGRGHSDEDTAILLPECRDRLHRRYRILR